MGKRIEKYIRSVLIPWKVALVAGCFMSILLILEYFHVTDFVNNFGFQSVYWLLGPATISMILNMR